MSNVAVPFQIDRYGESYTQQIKTNGIVRLEDDALVVELRDTTLDYTTLGTTTGNVNVIRIPLTEVESMAVSRNWPWGAKLALRTRTLGAIAAIPGAMGNECALRLRRRDHGRARELAVAVSLHLANEEMRRLGEGLT